MYGSRKGTIQKYFANPKNRNVFSKLTVEEFVKSKKKITNPKKIIGSTNNSSNNPKIFCKSIKTQFQIAIFVQIITEESVKSKKILQILRNVLDPQITFQKIRK